MDEEIALACRLPDVGPARSGSRALAMLCATTPAALEAAAGVCNDYQRRRVAEWRSVLGLGRDELGSLLERVREYAGVGDDPRVQRLVGLGVRAGLAPKDARALAALAPVVADPRALGHALAALRPERAPPAALLSALEAEGVACRIRVGKAWARAKGGLRPPTPPHVRSFGTSA